MPAEARAIGHVERILYLRRIPVIGTLPGPDLALMAEFAREQSFPKGSVLLREGEPVGGLHYLVEGTVHVSRRGRLIGHAGPGSAVGGIAVLARDGEGIQAVAESDTLTLELAADALLELLEDQFSIFHHVQREVCRQLIDLLQRFPAALNLPRPMGVSLARPAAGGDLDLVDRILILRQAAPFARASVNALAELSRGMAEVRFEPGANVWNVGDPSGWVLIILDGTLAATMATGHRVRMGPGTPPGALEGFGERPRWYSLVTETPVVALHGQMEGVLDIFEDNFDMASEYLAVMAKWLLEGLELASAPDEPELQRLYGCEEEEASADRPAPAEAGPGDNR